MQYYARHIIATKFIVAGAAAPERKGESILSEYAIEMLNITKRFPGIIANDNITLQLRKGEIHALLGENGAGTAKR